MATHHSPSPPASIISWSVPSSPSMQGSHTSMQSKLQEQLDDADAKSNTTDLCTGQHKDSVFFLDTVIFKVEDTLFKVPKQGFLNSTAFFEPKFLDCKSENDIIPLDTVSKDEFRMLLRMLYPLPLTSPHLFTMKEWVIILELSTCWSMLDLRNMAIRNLSSTSMTAVDRLVLGQKYSIPNWLTKGLTTLIRGPKSLPVDDDTTLGLSLDIDLKLRISAVRDASRRLPKVLDDVNWITSVRCEFEQELDLIEVTSVQCFVLARQHGVLEFLRAGYIELVERDEPLSDVEATALGCTTTAQICRIRENRITSTGDQDDFSVPEAVQRHFKEQLKCARSTSAIQRVLIAQRENIRQWLENALVEVAQSPMLTEDDVEALGQDMALKLYRVREAVFSSTWSETPVAICAARVATEFIDEIVTGRAQAKQFGGTDEASEVIGPSTTSGFEEEAIEVLPVDIHEDLSW